MKIAIGSDHAGFELKERIKQFLGDLGHEVLDKGTDSSAPIPYAPFCFAARSKTDKTISLALPPIA